MHNFTMKTKNRKKDLININFHDGVILNLNFNVGNNQNKSAEVIIMYYNWEENKDNDEDWTSKILQISIDCLVTFEFHNINSDYLDPFILDVTFDTDIEKILKSENEFTEYITSIIKNPSDYLCVKFNLDNFGNEEKPYNQAHLLLAGVGVKIKWLEEYSSPRTHFNSGEQI